MASRARIDAIIMSFDTLQRVGIRQGKMARTAMCRQETSFDAPFDLRDPEGNVLFHGTTFGLFSGDPPLECNAQGAKVWRGEFCVCRLRSFLQCCPR